MSQHLVPEAKNGLSKFKNEVANEMGVPFSDYNGDLSSRQCGSVGRKIRTINEIITKNKR